MASPVVNRTRYYRFKHYKNCCLLDGNKIILFTPTHITFISEDQGQLFEISDFKTIHKDINTSGIRSHVDPAAYSREPNSFVLSFDMELSFNISDFKFN